MERGCLYHGLLGHVWQLGLAIGSVSGGAMRLCEPWSLPIDDETRLDAGAKSYNIHVPGHDNYSASDEHHGNCNHVDVGRPNSYDYFSNHQFHRPEMAVILESFLHLWKSDLSVCWLLLTLPRISLRIYFDQSNG